MPDYLTKSQGLHDLIASATIETLAAERDAGIGLSPDTVEYLADCKGEPPWLRAQRLEALRAFVARDQDLRWAPPVLAELPFDRLRYYSAPASARQQAGRAGRAGSGATNQVLDTLGVAREEREFLGGAQAQVDSEVIHGSLNETRARAGVIFVDSSRGLTEYGELFRPHFGSVIGRDENLFTQLNAAVFSGGSFIYVPPGVKVVIIVGVQ